MFDLANIRQVYSQLQLTSTVCIKDGIEKFSQKQCFFQLKDEQNLKE